MDVSIAPGRPSVLVVEDDEGIATEILAELASRNYDAVHVATGPDALAEGRSQAFSAIIMDRMLPAMDGLTVIRTLREENIATPVLVLSALSEVDDRVRGLKAGGDDYLTKPFAMPELAARIEALLRRPLETRETVLRAGDLVLDLIERTARRSDRRIDLLPREFRLLEYLMRRPNQVLTRAMLLEDVWHYRFVPQTNLVDVHMGKLRRKIDCPGTASVIESVRGAGFLFRVPA